MQSERQKIRKQIITDKHEIEVAGAFSNTRNQRRIAHMKSKKPVWTKKHENQRSRCKQMKIKSKQQVQTEKHEIL